MDNLAPSTGNKIPLLSPVINLQLTPSNMLYRFMHNVMVSRARLVAAFCFYAKLS